MSVEDSPVRGSKLKKNVSSGMYKRQPGGCSLYNGTLNPQGRYKN